MGYERIAATEDVPSRGGKCMGVAIVEETGPCSELYR